MIVSVFHNANDLSSLSLKVCNPPLNINSSYNFGLSNDNVQYNQRYYTTNPLTTPTDVKYKKKKYSPKILVWMAISSKASAHYANSVLNSLKETNAPIIHKLDNPPNVPQARSIETVCSLLEQKVYENNWQAETIDSLVRRTGKNLKNSNKVRYKQ
ncbi:unnamed protein product [Rotaria magnacalcarata]